MQFLFVCHTSVKLRKKVTLLLSHFEHQNKFSQILQKSYKIILFINKT